MERFIFLMQTIIIYRKNKRDMQVDVEKNLYFVKATLIYIKFTNWMKISSKIIMETIIK